MSGLLINLNIVILVIILIVAIVLLSKSADFLVKSAVAFSRSIGISEIIIGATIVSLGTTLPEFTSSIIAASLGGGRFLPREFSWFNNYKYLSCPWYWCGFWCVAGYEKSS